MTGTLFITAPDADAKFVNRLLLHLRDWESGPEGPHDWLKLITTTSYQAIPSKASKTLPPVIDFNVNEWAGKTIQDVEVFALEHSDENVAWGLSMHNSIIVDEQGMRDGTCIILDRVFEDEDNPAMTPPGNYNKMRLLWEDTYSPWCNFDVGNMAFEEYCYMDKGFTRDGWWVYKDLSIDCGDATRVRLEEEKHRIKGKRDRAIKALEELGYA